MISCPECDREGEKSRLREGARYRVPGRRIEYYDEAGELHIHDARYNITPFLCSRGHTFEHRGIIGCPTCGVRVDPAGQDEFGRTAP